MLISSISSNNGLQIFSMAFVRSGGDSIRHFSMFAFEFLTNESRLLKFALFASVLLLRFVVAFIHSKVFSSRSIPANVKISFAVLSGLAAMSR